MPCSSAKRMASSYPASAWRTTPIPGSVVRTGPIRRSASSVPSHTTRAPAWVEYPMQTPPPLWMATRSAPAAVFRSAFSNGQSAIASEPSRIPSVSRYGEATDPASRWSRVITIGPLSSPIVITRDHLDAGSVASPYRETEGMRDGSDAIADWPLLNALLNTAAGADLVAIHNGGGVCIGYSTHAGALLVCDGTEDAERRIVRVLTTDPGMGVVRHADAGYEDAIRFADQHGIRMPSRE